MTKQTTRSVRHKLSQAVGMTTLIFAVTLGAWAIQRYQEGDAAQLNNLSITPTSGQAPLTVTAKYTGPISTPPASRTVNFDDQLDGTVITDQYQASHGVTFASQAGSLVHTRVNNAGCPGSGTEATSAPNFLTGQLSQTEPIEVTLDTLTRAINFQLVSVGANTVETVFYDAAKNVLETIEVGGRTDDETGACQKDLVTYTGSDLVTSFTVRVSNLVTNNDGFGIDDLTFTPFDGEGAGIVAWDFGDASGWQQGATLSHTYQQPGTYSVNFQLGDAVSAGVATIVVTETVELAVSPRAGTAPLAVTATHTNARANQSRTWDFGDGTVITNTETQVSHTYGQAGSYKVSLTVNGSTTSQQVSVTAPATAAAHTTLRTSQDVYTIGVTDVSFTLTNLGPDPILLANTSPWRIKQANVPIFTPIGAEMIQSVTPGNSLTWTWNHKNDAGTLVAPGAYSVLVTYEIGTAGSISSATKEVVFTLAAANQIVSSVTPTPAPAGTPTTQATSGVLSAVPMTGPAPLAVRFTYSASGSNLILDYGDGTVTAASSGPLETTHSYALAGRYVASLRSGSQIIDKKLIDVYTASSDPKPLPSITDSSAPSAAASATAADTTKSSQAQGSAKTSVPTGEIKQLVSTGIGLGTSLWIAAILSLISTVLIMRKA